MTLAAAQGGGGANGPALGRGPDAAKVSQGGGTTYAVPIVVPPGTRGVQPNLSLAYNSQAQLNEILGFGWKLVGLPTIERCPRTIAQDGVRGGVNYDSKDRFCLDGARLIMVPPGSNYGGPNTEYRTEIDTFVKVVAYGVAGSGPSYFKAWTKEGNVMEFGNTADSKVEALGQSSVRVWALNKMSDVKGNSYNVSYYEDNTTNGEYRPWKIDYTANTGLNPTRQVVFEYNNGPYNPRPDQIPTYIGGSKILITKLLTNIKTYAPLPNSSNPVLVRDYRFTYENGNATKRSRLKTINECDSAGNCLPANTAASKPIAEFTWQDTTTNGFGADTSWGIGVNYILTNIGDFNGDGKLTTCLPTMAPFESNSPTARASIR